MEELTPVTHRIEGGPKGGQTRCFGKGEPSQSVGWVGAAEDTEEHTGARTHAGSGEHALAAFWQGRSVSQTLFPWRANHSLK